ncbi:MAG TPA: hypothetical protein VK534_02335 [Methylomirabilota bacterium]|nr:hypothetical protein [Methylomirabilota bacterium]
MNQSRETFKIVSFDTTCRDGAQALPQENQFEPGAKVDICREIASLGTETIEAGFPATPGDAEEVQAVAETVGNQVFLIEPRRISKASLIDDEPYSFTPVITGLTRADPEEIDTTWEAVQPAINPGIHTFVATADNHMKAKHPGKDRQGVAQMAVMAARHAREVGGPETRVEFSCEAASTSNSEYLERIVKLVLQEDIDVVNMPDTLGAASAQRIRRMFQNVTRWVIEEGLQDRVIISAHNHNDGARAVANTIEAAHAVLDTAINLGVKPPVFQAEVTNGPDLGERNGNTSFAPWAQSVLTDAEEFARPIDFKVDTTRVLRAAQLVANQAGIEIPAKTPVIGVDSRIHRSGIHSDAIVKGGASIYAHIDPRWFGWDEAAILEDGNYQGRNGRANLGEIQVFAA